MKSCFDSQASLPQSLSHRNLQTAQPLPQGLSEEALKEALQVQSIWVESQDVQEARCQEIEREVCTNIVCVCTLLKSAGHNKVVFQVALLSPFIHREVLRCGHGLAQADPVVLPKQVYRPVCQALLLVLQQDRLIG